jgi:hypothetical protein
MMLAGRTQGVVRIMTRGTTFAACAFVLTSACSSGSDLGNGFEIIDGGGSKQSLARNGEIILNYTVTGIGDYGGIRIIESKEYDESLCEYYLIDNEREELVRINDSDEAVHSIEPINQRSCRTP